MEKRRLGKTGHMSTIVAIGGAALGAVTQAEADAGMNLAMEQHITHIDVAPAYGEAELRIGPRVNRYRKDFFSVARHRPETRLRPAKTSSARCTG